MSAPLKRLFVAGYPCLYGGAGAELYHQILLWVKMEIEVHLIPPCNSFYEDMDMLYKMANLNVILHPANEWSVLRSYDPIISFCNYEFLRHISDVFQRTRKIIFVNCMTWLFEEEKKAMEKGQIAMFLYQNEDVRQKLMPELKKLNNDPVIRFLAFSPYFHHEDFPFVAQRPSEYFGCGRISRQDSDKFAADTLKIYEYFVSPVPKRGLFLGFDERSRKKIGVPMDWIKTAFDHNVVSQQEFYKHCKIILQPADTTENWPRIGFEAMSSGSVLIVDNRGGWQRMIEHGKTGWLCNHERDFIYYAGKMAYEPTLLEDMSYAAREKGLELGGFDRARESWEEIFHAITQLPE